VSLNKLREMAELFKTEMDDMTRHVRSIELHILDSYVRAGLMQMAPFPTTKAPFAQPRQPSSPPQAGQSESSVSPLGMNRQPISLSPAFPSFRPRLLEQPMDLIDRSHTPSMKKTSQRYLVHSLMEVKEEQGIRMNNVGSIPNMFLVMWRHRDGTRPGQQDRLTAFLFLKAWNVFIHRDV